MNQPKQTWLISCIVFIFAFATLGQVASAHPGRTDSSGCHTCRTNCPNWGLSTGEYHCHRAKALPQPEPPIKSHRGVNGAPGYTEPAPEYQKPSTTITPQTGDTLNGLKPSTIPQPQAVAADSQPKKGFWQWLFSFFR